MDGNHEHWSGDLGNVHPVQLDAVAEVVAADAVHDGGLDDGAPVPVEAASIISGPRTSLTAITNTPEGGYWTKPTRLTNPQQGSNSMAGSPPKVSLTHFHVGGGGSFTSQQIWIPRIQNWGGEAAISTNVTLSQECFPLLGPAANASSSQTQK